MDARQLCHNYSGLSQVGSSQTGGPAWGTRWQAAGEMDDRPSSADPRDETKEQKKARVAQHRQDVLRRIQKESKKELVHKKMVFICPVEFDNK